MEAQNLNHFRMLTKSVPADDFAWMMKMSELRTNIYVYDGDTKSVHNPSQQELAWPGVMILARYHRKHVLHNKQPPNPKKIREALSDFINKIKWRYYFKDSSNNRIYWKRSRCSQFIGAIPPELQFCIQGASKAMSDAAFRAKQFCQVKKRGWSNFSALDRLGFKSLDDAGWKILPTDKDGGLCLVEPRDLTNLAEKAMMSSCYIQIQRSSINIDNIFKDYYRIIDDLPAEHFSVKERRHLKGALNGVGLAGMVGKVIFNMKTHKPAGKVTTRNIHASAGSPFKALGKVVAQRLALELSLHDHLYKDTPSFIDQLKKVKVDHDDFIWKIDVKEYFMSGDHDTLAEKAVMILHPQHRKAYRRAIVFSLHTSTLLASKSQTAFFQCCLGRGTGMNCSGEISDSTLWYLCEG